MNLAGQLLNRNYCCSVSYGDLMT